MEKNLLKFAGVGNISAVVFRDGSTTHADTDGERRPAADREAGASDDEFEGDESLRLAAQRLYDGDGLVDVLA